jgi:hypothetical protein
MGVRMELRSLYGDFKRRARGGTYEDGALSLIAIAMITYFKNLIFNWQFPEIVEFDLMVLRWLLTAYIVITILQEIRKFFQKRGFLNNEKFDLDLDKLRFEVKQLLGSSEG